MSKTTVPRSSSSPLTPPVPPPEVSREDSPFVAVIGIGYIGTHLVKAFSPHYPVIGYDVSSRRIGQLRDEYQGSGVPELTTSKAKLTRATHFLIGADTPPG